MSLLYPIIELCSYDVVFHSGGGISGLCIAVALSRCSDIEVNVYEAASSFKEIGAGVMIWGRAWRALSLLGFDKIFREVAGAPVDGSAGDYMRFALHSPWLNHAPMARSVLWL